MENTLFALRGKQRWGKTTTLRLVWNRLRELFPDARVGNPSGVKSKEIRGAWLEINGVKIGFTTKSEPVESKDRETLVDDLHELAEAGCNVIVCASHGLKDNGSPSSSEDAVQEFAGEENWQFVPIDKIWSATPEEYAVVNRQQAEEIVNRIRLSIESAKLVGVP